MQENGEEGRYSSEQQIVLIQGSFILAGKVSKQKTIIEDHL